eukprot:XP_766655.1 hypothetical protein [Theileria parva strain Muguga]
MFKIFYWIWIFTALESYLNSENGFLNHGAKNNFVYSFKCSNYNKLSLKSVINTPVSYNRVRNHAISTGITETAVKSEVVPTTESVDYDYLSNLIGELIRFSSSVDKNQPEIFYNELKDILGNASHVVSELFTPPVELDYVSKLGEIKIELGEKIDKIEPHHLIKPLNYKHFKHGFPFTYEYLTDFDPLSSQRIPKLWRRVLKPNISKLVRKKLFNMLEFLSKSLGLFMVTFHETNLPIPELYKVGSTLGLEGTTLLFEGITLLHLRDDYYGTDLKARIDKSFELIEYTNKVNLGRNRNFSLIIENFFRRKDYESIFYIIKYMSERLNRKINGLYLVQFLVSLAHRFKALKNEQNGLNAKLFSELKKWIKQGLELYEKSNLHAFNITDEFAGILEKNYRDLAPGLFRIVSVSSGNSPVPFGSCDFCKFKIQFQDISDSDRFEIFSKMIKSIFNTSVREFFPLFEFYTFLLKASVDGNPYTCIIDGQNVGYYRNKTRILDYTKLKDALNFFESSGENPLIVLPVRCYKKLLYHLEKTDRPNYDFFAKLHENRSIYLTNSYSYDDNYFLLAGIVKFTEDEIKLFDQYMKQTSVQNSYHCHIDYCLKNINNAQFKKSDKNTIILTNDRLSNLLIEDVNTEVLNTWKNYSLISFTGFAPRTMLTMGQRVNYTFSVISDNDKFHIPVGRDRVFTNNYEIHKCELRLEKPTRSFETPTIPGTGKLSLKILNCEETPNKKWLQHNQHLLFDTPELTPSFRSSDNNSFKDENYTYHNLNGVNNSFKDENYTYHNLNVVNNGFKPQKRSYGTDFSEIYHNSPEILEQMFIPNSRSKWLCVDLSSIDSLISNL